MVRGKVVKSTHYFDELGYTDKAKLVKALEVDPGMREDADCRLIEPFVRSMSLFKLYSEFESSDFQNILQEMKLHKLRKGQRLTNFGDTCDSFYLVLSGRIAVTHPNASHFQIIADHGHKILKERT